MMHGNKRFNTNSMLSYEKEAKYGKNINQNLYLLNMDSFSETHGHFLQSGQKYWNRQKTHHQIFFTKDLFST
jgi:hypothetical protein